MPIMFEPERPPYDPFMSRSGKRKIRLDGQQPPEQLPVLNEPATAPRLRPAVPLTTAVFAVLVLLALSLFHNS